MKLSYSYEQSFDNYLKPTTYKELEITIKKE